MTDPRFKLIKHQPFDPLDPTYDVIDTRTNKAWVEGETMAIAEGVMVELNGGNCGIGELREVAEGIMDRIKRSGTSGKAGWLWHLHGHYPAHAEGWDLYLHSGNGTLEIEVNNNPEDWPEGAEEQAYPDDLTLLATLFQRTERGDDRLALLALYLDGRPPDLETYLPQFLMDPNALQNMLAEVDRLEKDDNWSDYGKEYPASDWRSEVSQGDTVLGYWDWVRHSLERDLG